MTAVLLLLVMSILTAKRIYGAVHLPILKARQAPQAITPVIDTNAFNQCFKNSAVTFAGSPCYPAVYDFVQCFEINQTMMWDQTPAGIYECACLPWPIDNRTLLNDMNHCSSCLVDHGQPAEAIGLKADTSAWNEFCSWNTASNVNGDVIQALLQDAPFFPALNQLEQSATTAYVRVTTGIIGTLTTAAASVTITPTSVALSGWETEIDHWPPPVLSTTDETTSSTVADATGTDSSGSSPTVTTRLGFPLISSTSAIPPTTPPSSASATATGGASTILRVEMLALVMLGILAATISSM